MLPTNVSANTIEWLLVGDPAVRWQVMRDLTAAPERAVKSERGKIARNGWGARLLARQDSTGRWAGGKASDSGLYSPKWTSTHYTMLELRDFGLPPGNRRARRACKVLLDNGLQPDGGISYGTWAKWTRRGETCVTGMSLSILAYFEYDDPRLELLSRHLLERQMPDGGWNCRREQGATHSSVHTTISVLEGLRQFQLLRKRQHRTLWEAQRRGREFLLAHRLFRSHRTGAVIKPVLLRFCFPPRWHYDVLRALDHFQAIDAPADTRLADAVAVGRRKRLPNGRWPLEGRYPGKRYFDMEPVGAASRWNTLRALRVLAWWERKTGDGGRKEGRPKAAAPG